MQVPRFFQPKKSPLQAHLNRMSEEIQGKRVSITFSLLTIWTCFRSMVKQMQFPWLWCPTAPNSARMKNSVWWKEQEGRGEKGEVISIRGEETGCPTMAPVPNLFLGPGQHQQLGWCWDCCILSQACCTSSCPPPSTVAAVTPPCVTSLWHHQCSWFGASWAGRAKGCV